MKRLIALALSVLMIFTCFVGCKDKANDNLANAVAYLENMYQTGEKGKPMEMLVDKDFLNVVTIDGVSYAVEWAVTVTEGASDAVKIAESDTENCIKIDVPEMTESDILFTATATVKDEKDNTATAEFSYKVTGVTVSTGDDVATILTNAYALAEGAKLDGEQTLTGTIKSIDTPYSDQYKNVTVTIVVEGHDDKPIKCFRLSGEGADTLTEGDKITVTGTIVNYQGTIEFDAGCVVKEIVKVSEAPKDDDVDDDEKTPEDTSSTEAPPQTMAQIVDEAYKLTGSNTIEATLTGKVSKLKTPYDANFKNMTVVMVVEGKEDKPIECYRMQAESVGNRMCVGDTITVTGTIKNYNGTIEFDAGCALRSHTSCGVVVPTDPKAIVDAAFALQPTESLPYFTTLTGKITKIATPYDAGYKNLTVIIEVEGTSGVKELKCYRMKGDGAENLVEGDVISVTGIIKNYKHSSGDCEVEFDASCTFTK
ncbi:MAG: hypothetical protein IJN56_02740 [Clostridia bacterium]|nr:hypothetical protein [Clostridia bacterium]